MAQSASGQVQEQARARGRPRDTEVDARILKEALRLLGEVGYSRMSLDEVAAAAGVTRPTIYLRYANKTALAAAALASARERTPLPEPTGDTYADLVAQLRHFQEGVTYPYGMSMIGALLAEEHAIPELLALYRERVVTPRRNMIRQVLAHAQAEGIIRPTADVELAVAQLIGSYYALYVAGNPIPSDWPERAASMVLRGLAT